MGNAQSGGGVWPVKHGSTKAFQAMADKDADVATATFGAGCYWGTDKYYAQDMNVEKPGAVIATSVGFMGAPTCAPNPTYRQVCSGTTGHVEVCQVKYDPKHVTYEDLCMHFYTFHDPTTVNRQGNDSGTQYASVVFVHDGDQRVTAERVKDKVQTLVSSGAINAFSGKTVSTGIQDATTFYPAEEAHQKYLEKRPSGYCNHRKRFRWCDILVK
mmetsp:Transcript_26461/g.66322  ORF Transcript_26461/g.66322 Transcript_26461/m.66322 type:complete len:214 (-) Transcript_26461:262-903(-)